MTTTFATMELENYNNIIEEIEAEIQQLQASLSQCQSERQNVQSIEQMGMSAIGQIAKTLAACNHAGLAHLANNFKEQVMIALNDDNSDKKAELPAVDVEKVTDNTPSVQPQNDDEILETIKVLDKEHLTNNYLPIYLYRQAFSQLTRDEQDKALYRLEAEDRIELSALQEVRSYNDEQIKAGIPQDIGGRLFFIIVTEDEKRSPSTKTAVKRIPTSVGAAAANDVSLMSFKELKTYCLGLGMNKNDIRKHGKLTRRDTWISALEDFS